MNITVIVVWFTVIMVHLRIIHAHITENKYKSTVPAMEPLFFLYYYSLIYMCYYIIYIYTLYRHKQL